MKRTISIKFADPGADFERLPERTTASLTVMTHDSFAVSDDVIAQFEQENNVKVNFLLSGDAGSTLNRAVLSKDAPVADVLYGVDNTFLSRALSEDIFETYASPLLDQIPDALKLDDQDRALPVDYGDVCVNYDKAYFAEHNLALPTIAGRSDQTRIRWAAGG